VLNLLSGDIGVVAVVCSPPWKCSKASRKSELSAAEELGEEEGPNNIARQIAQMTQRFGNAEKDPGSPRLPFHKAHSADLV
jgi:hypothetical protein